MNSSTTLAAKRMTVRTPFSGLAVLLALLLTSCSKTESNRGDADDQIKLIETALGIAHSWHISSTFAINGVPSHIEEDVGCPYDFHRVGKVPDAGYRQADEIIARQNGFYYREGERWYGQHIEPNPKPTNYCLSGANAGGSPLTSELEKLKHRASLTTGEVQSIDGALCREFDFIGTEAPHAKLASLCIDEQTNLPFEYRHDDDVYRYSKWNNLVTVELPPGSRD
jgi:hypothetical protein